MSPSAPQFNDGQLPISHSNRAWRSWSLSLFLHVLLIVGALVSWTTVERQGVELDRHASIVLALVDVADREKEYLTEAVERADRELNTSSSQEQPSTVESQPPAEVPTLGDLSTGQSFPINSPGPAAQADIQSPTPTSDVSHMLNSAGAKGLNEQPKMSEEDLLRLEEEQALVAARRPKGEPISLSVFGSEKFSGRKFVFLLDQSNSMGSGGLGVLGASKSELNREIAKLLDYHEFQIVAYNDRTSVIGKRKLLPATAQNKRKVSNFIDGLVAFGGTQHMGGLMVALGLEPDVIVVISDGGYPTLKERDLLLVERFARGKTQIHCLQFGAGATPEVTSGFMRKLASQNGGSYRYIDVSPWETNKN